MARIAGIDLPRNKRGIISLQYIFGIGASRAKNILEQASISEDVKVQDWSDDNVMNISRIIQEQFKVEGELRSEVQLQIKRLMDIACYRGLRHRKGMPVRGQRTRTNARTRRGRKGQAIGTKTNARTRKGKRKTVANKKKVTK